MGKLKILTIDMILVCNFRRPRQNMTIQIPKLPFNSPQKDGVLFTVERKSKWLPK